MCSSNNIKEVVPMNSKNAISLQTSTLQSQEEFIRRDMEHNTPSNPEDYCYAVTFKVFGHLSFILALVEKGIFVKIYPTFEYACARFNNTHDFNAFKATLASI